MAMLDTDAMLRAEANAVHGLSDEQAKGLQGAALYPALNGLDRCALCLSGGGIRSASFALGVIQALAAHPRSNGAKVEKPEYALLAKFHYLSTVSGGGYIGSWLSAWITRRDWPVVWEALVGKRGADGTEPHEITWLRVYSNYLTPKLGLTSADAWTDIALYLRNLILNWVVLFPAFIGLLLFLKEMAIVTGWVGKYSPQVPGPLFYILGVGAVLLLTALVFNTRNRPSRGANRATQATFLWFNLMPALTAGFGFALALALQYAPSAIRESAYFASFNGYVFAGAAIGAGCYLLSWLAALFFVPWKNMPRGAKNFWGDMAAWTISGGVFGVVVAIGVYLYVQRFGEGAGEFFKTAEVILLVFGVPWMLGAHLCGDIVFAALTSYEDQSDADHEWLGRAAGWYLVWILLWLLLTILVFCNWDWVFGLLKDYVGDHYKEWLASIGGVSGVVTWLVGKSGLTPAVGQPKNKKEISAQLVLAIAAPIFVVTVIISASAALDYLLFGTPLVETEFWQSPVDPNGWAAWPNEGTTVLCAIVIMVLIGIVASWFVNINRFSLHALYRNRLIRAFLGASNVNRVPNLFTGLDETDNVDMKALWPVVAAAQQGANWRPYHVINMALNIVSSKRLDWQERKAEPFLVSPRHSGSSCKGFRETASYGHPGRGISLGTALAISGAAASPNMGYQSSQAAALALSLFNVRLGWWLGNPGTEGNRTYTREGPAIAFLPFLYEMFAQTTDERAYVYLSDGGHFENLGLYEMVRRRCRFIVVSDAGCDPAFAFEDLGNAVRKIGIDLGVPIEFDALSALKSRAALEEAKDKKEADGATPSRAYAIGTINYAAADAGAKEGYILYVKPSYYAGTILNAGVRNYATAHPDFPHETTADQWFSESQLESYRALGFELMDEILNEAESSGPCSSLEQVFAAFAKRKAATQKQRTEKP